MFFLSFFQKNRLHVRAHVWGVIFLSLALGACSSDNMDFSFLDNNTSGSGESAPCDILSITPSNVSQMRMPATGSSATRFTVIPTSSSCRFTFTLNGTVLVAQSEQPYRDILPSDLNAGNNTLEVVASDGISTQSKTWTIRRNTPPLCSSQTPGVNGNSLGVAATLWLTANAVDADGDTLSFSWQDNGADLDPAILFITNGPGNSIGRFIPAAGQVGANHIVATISDGYDSSYCDWNVGVTNNCSLASYSPSSPTPRVSSIGGTVNSFSVIPNDGSCSVTWERNGSALPDNTLSISVLSSDLLAGNNTIKATLTNGSSTVTKTWNVLKNTPPSCSAQTPGAGGNTVNVGSPITLIGTGSDINSDSLTFTWRANGSAANPSHFSISSPSGTQTQAIFTPISAYAGSNSISADISDGLDSASCTWSVNVINNCSFTGASPAAATVRVSNVGTTNSTFVATPNDGSCLMSWTLNGSSLGATGTLVNVLSSSLQPGINTLIATASNGLSTIQQVWTVVKNTPPACTTQTPNGAISMGVGTPQNIRVDSVDANGDSLYFSWKNNGVAVNPAHFTTSTPAVNASQVAFTPTVAYVGANTVSVDVSDTYDVTSCTWPVTVANNCSVSSSLPAGATHRAPASSGSVNTFVIVPNDGSCAVTWELNGAPLAGGAATFKNILSGDLNAGANTLVATLSNGVGANATRTWTITKNSPPVCFSQNQTPGPVGSMLYDDTKTFSAVVTDANGDAMVTHTWKYNGGTSDTLFPPGEKNTPPSQPQATFHPTLSEVGANRLISVDVFDGYDSQTCQWTLQIDDPNAALTINSCTPMPYTTVSGNPPDNGSAIVLKTTDVSTNFNVSATGTLLSYQWFLNGSEILGATNSSYHLPYASLPATNNGYATLEVKVTDTYSNNAYCSFKVKKNFAPTITGGSPSNASALKMNSATTLPLSVTANDDNGDSLIYSWTLDSVAQPSYLSTGLSTSTFSPNQQSTLLGDRTATVTVTDVSGESATRSWTINVNEFSTYCNGLSAGQMCTLVGTPGAGNGRVPSADQTKIKLSPEYVIDDGAGNLFIADSHSHSVWFLNRSGASVVRLGKTIPAGQFIALVGNGAFGRNEENLSYKYTENKLYTPRGLAYDAVGNRLWIADYSNNRVVMLNNSGDLTTVFGTCGAGASVCATTQNVGTNTDGGAGTAHVCGAPVGLWYNTSTSNLYIACSSTAAIKRLDVGANQGHMVVGKLTAGATTAVVVDGTLGSGGTAQTHTPWDLKGDPNTGNLYFTESSNGNSSRLRMINLSGGTVNLFDDGVGAATLLASDTSGTPLTASVGLGTTMTSSATGAASSIEFMGPTSMINNKCYPIMVVSKDAGGNVINTTGAINFTLSSNGTGTLYTNAGCTGGVPPGVIGAGTSQFLFYYMPTANNTGKTLTATGAPVSVTALTYSSAVTATPAKLELVGPTTIPQGKCQQYLVLSSDNTGLAAQVGANKTIVFDDGGKPGSFYSNSTCTTMLGTTAYAGSQYPSVTLSSGTNVTAFYYKKLTPLSVSPSNVKTIVGTATNGLVNSSYNLITLGLPYGLELLFSGPSLLGFFISNQQNNQQVFLNQSAADIVIGGARVRPYESVTVLGTGTAGYNGEGVGYLTRTNNSRGMVVSGTELVFADLTNSRLRSLDLAIGNGQTSTLLGAGRLRNGFIGDSPLPAPSVMTSSPNYLYINPNSSTLYYSDLSNFRIRAVNLKTGIVSTVIGTGAGGDGTVENQDPTAVLMRAPQGITQIGSTLFYMDQTNGNCMMRAYNPTGSSVSLFNNLVTLQANSVATVAGDFTLGCVGWNAGTPNVNGTSALLNHLTNNEGIATDGTNVYIVAFADHCIIKMDANGKLYQFLGLCGTAGNVDGQLDTAVRLQSPTGIVMDPESANAGNFFFIDQNYNGGTARVKYVNFKTSTVNIAGVTVPAAINGSWSGGSVIPYVKTFSTWGGTGGNAQRWNAIAAFDKWVCFSGGVPGSADTGSHNITCRDRTNNNRTLMGLDETLNTVTTRAGAPLGLEQEGIDPTQVANNQARFYAPYGLAFDTEGNLYVAERGSHVIRMIKRWW